MLQACAQAIDFKVGHHFGEGQVENAVRWAYYMTLGLIH
jgi:hypothetical protein